MDTQIATQTAAELDSIDAALGSLDLDLNIEETGVLEEITEADVLEAVAEEETVTEEPAVEELDQALALDDDALNAIELEAAKEDAYGEQEAESSDVGDTTATPAPAAAKPAKAAAAKTPKAPKAPRDLASLPESAFVLSIANPPEDLAQNKADVMARAPGQKKVNEKFENLLLTVPAGKRPSTYTMDCFAALVNKGGTITSTDLVATLKATVKKDGNCYTEGTARSQAGQIMALFPILEIATRVKQTLTLNEDSLLAFAMKEMLSKEEEA
jgi:hypothetical protein